MTRRHKLFGLLMQKAAQDEYVLDKLAGDAGAPPEILGFHAQQAAEKILKAVLALKELPYPPTHRLTELLDLAKAGGIAVPDPLEDIRHLTPFAVEYRYDVFPEKEADPLDKAFIKRLVADLRVWAENLFKEDQT